MGRKKIQIKPISDEKTRLVTFAKRKNGLFKKAYELSVLCQCEIAIVVFTKSNRLHQYASRTIDHALRRREAHARANEFCSNADMARWVTQRETGGARAATQSSDSVTHDQNVGASINDEQFDDSDVDVTPEDQTYRSSGSSAADRNCGSRLDSLSVSGPFQPQLSIYTNPAQYEDQSIGADLTGQTEENKMQNRSLVMLDDLINATSSANAVATSLAYLHSHYPSSFSSALGMNVGNQSIMIPSINTSCPNPTERLSTTTTAAENGVTNGEDDGISQRRLVCLDGNSSQATNDCGSSTSASLTNSMLVHLTTSECSSLTPTISDDPSSLSSLLLSDRRDAQTGPMLPVPDRTGLMRTGTDDCPIECELPRFGVTPSNGETDMVPTVSVSVDTSDIKQDENEQTPSHIGQLKQQLYAFVVPPHQAPSCSHPASIPTDSSFASIPVSLPSSISSSSSLSSLSSSSVLGTHVSTVEPDVTPNSSSPVAPGGIRPAFGGKPLTRGLSSLGAGRHKKFPALSQLKMPPFSTSTPLLTAAAGGAPSSLTGRLPQGTFLPTPEVESVLKNLETSRAPVAQTSMDVVQSVDGQGAPAYPLDLRLTPPVPAAQTTQSVTDPFAAAMRMVTVGGHLTSVPLPKTPTTPNPPLLHHLSGPGESILASPLVSADSTQRCAFKAVKRKKPL
ncbi:Myocyte-specific enhancer factor 2B [Fasciola gigantica]|uniref:Myocyte-specific enhancer factor 2B n=1 Tax=Fasciola gigantica TaxID=46835 RepID=A0A504YEX8_FASGI|nr:Myocyte-specific enhancer factor 2B [Fasciola gigantica]